MVDVLILRVWEMVKTSIEEALNIPDKSIFSQPVLFNESLEKSKNGKVRGIDCQDLKSHFKGRS